MWQLEHDVYKHVEEMVKCFLLPQEDEMKYAKIFCLKV